MPRMVVGIRTVSGLRDRLASGGCGFSGRGLCNRGVRGLASAPFFPLPGELCLHMPAVRVRDNEPFEVALRRFKRTCEKAGVLTDVRKKEFFEKPSMERKRKRAAAVKRQQKRVSRDVTRRTRLY